MGIAIANEIVGEQEALKYLVSCSKSAADAARKDGGTDLWCFQNIDDGITIFDDDAGEILHTFTLSDLSVDLSRPAREHLYYIGEEIWDMVYKLGISCTG